MGNRQMTRNLHGLCLLIASFPTLLLAWGCASKNLESCWREGEVCIDGRGRDWSETPLHYLEDMKLSYGIANDDDSLFLVLTIRDYHTVRMLERRGLTLWFDVDCDNNKTLGVRYAEGASLHTEALRTGEDRPKRYTMKDFRQKHQPPGPKGEFSFLAGSEPPLLISKAGLKGLEAAAGCEEWIFCYEIRIPLRGGADGLVALNAVPGQEIEMGIEIGAASPAERRAAEARKEEMSKRRGGGPPGGGGGGGRGGGMGPGGQPGGGREGLMKSLDAKEIWISLKLAEKATTL